MDHNSDTIAAIATPLGNAGIGIIRISGEDAIRIADKVIRSRSGKSLDLFSVLSHTVHYGYVMDNDEVIDEVLCTVLKRPRSYTAEDTVEISCHGGMFVLNRVLSLIISHGARQAREGEFTERAFLNGRIDLSQAESVMDIISSENEFSRKNSLSQLKGSVREKITELREKIIHESAFIEAALDDPEHYDINDEYKGKLKKTIAGIKEEIDIILKDAENIRFLKNGVNTVITGKPNAGKSSLLNLFAGYDKAIVTSVPGTTRDIVEEKISLDGLILNITDTAGIRESSDEVEKIGIEKARDCLDRADLIIYLVDSSAEIDSDDEMIMDAIKGKNYITVLNKSDLKRNADTGYIKEKTGKDVMEISVRENKGIDKLTEKIKDMFIKGNLLDSNRLFVTNKRQISLLKRAYESLVLVCDSIEKGQSEDLYTVDMMDAYAALGSIIGEDISDDLADRIFSEFCMGK